MKCDRCQQNEASVHISQTVDGEHTEQNLCQSCAQDEGIKSQFQNFYSPSGSQLVCKNCGTTFEGFRKSGLFGCPQCYESFREKLDPVLRRVQGGTRHVGRTACKTAESKEQLMLKAKIEELRKNLTDVVKLEQYEEAARLRDEIQILNTRLCEQQELEAQKNSSDEPSEGKEASE